MATIRELKKEASELYIKGYSNMTKDELFKAIQRHRFIEQQAEREMEEAVTHPEASTTTTRETVMNTTHEFNFRNIPAMALQGYVWAGIYLYNNRNSIWETYCLGAERLVDHAEKAYNNLVNLTLVICVLVHFAGAAWAIWMDDLADYIADNTELDMALQLWALTKRGLGALVNWYQSTFAFAYGSGYFFVYAGTHSFRFNFKPRFSFTHINSAY